MADTRQSGNGRMMLLLIAGIPVTIILVATWLWYFVVQGDLDLVGVLGTANRGALVQPPRQLDDQALHDAAGVPVTVAGMAPRWAMVVPVAGASCDQACEQSLYVTRQIHVAMGKEFNRLRRLYISTANPADTKMTVPTLSDGHPVPAAEGFARYLETEHTDLQTLTLSASSYATLFPEQGADPSTWYLVDPAGWVMMSYNSGVSYKDVIADLKFLLKNSGG